MRIHSTYRNQQRLIMIMIMSLLTFLHDTSGHYLGHTSGHLQHEYVISSNNFTDLPKSLLNYHSLSCHLITPIACKYFSVCWILNLFNIMFFFVWPFWPTFSSLSARIILLGMTFYVFSLCFDLCMYNLWFVEECVFLFDFLLDALDWLPWPIFSKGHYLFKPVYVSAMLSKPEMRKKCIARNRNTL